MKQKSVGLTLRAFIFALALILVAGSPALPPFDGVAYAQAAGPTLTATSNPDGSAVSLSWSAVTDADEYQVWKGMGSGTAVQWGTSPHATVTGTTYSDTAVTAGGTYSYAVRAVVDGTNGAYSRPVSLTTAGGTPKPTAKSTVTAASDGLTAIDVSWDPVSGATSYDVQYWTSGLSNWMSLATGETGTTYKHTGLTSGTTYWYVVRGVNSGGNGPWSDYASHTLTATTTVPVLTLRHTSRTTVELSWTPTSGTAVYDLHRAKLVNGDATNANSVAFTRLPSNTLSGTSYTDNGATYTPSDATSVVYRYRVQAVENGVAGNWSNEVSVTIPSTSNRLSAPASPNAVAQDHANISFRWAGVAGATYYQVQSKTGDGSYSSPMRVEPLADPTSTVVYNHSGLSPSTKYTYQVRAVNINGPSDWSAEASATTRATPSATGQMPKVMGLRVTDETTSDGRKIKLTWNAVSGATHYDIRRFSPVGTTPNWVSPADGNMLTTGRISVAGAKSPPTWEDMDTALAAGMTYYYVVSAVDDRTTDPATPDTNAANDIMGEWSDYMMVTLKDNAPAMPTTLTATPTGERSVWVSWSQPAADATTSPPIGTATSWTLEWRLTGQNAAWNPETVTAGTTFNHTGRQPNTQYHYRVRANNSGGMSGWTDEASTTTLPSVLGPPSGLTAVDATDGTNARIKVSWTAVTGATGYEIQRFGAGTDNNMWGNLADDAPSDTATGITVVSGTMVTDDNDDDPAAVNSGTNLVANTTYYYRVRTVTGDVKSKWSTVVSGATKHSTPAAPTLRATSTGMSMIRLSWSAVDAATNYQLEFLEGMHAAAIFDNALITRGEITVSGNDRHYVHRNLKAGTLYTYRLRAVLPQDVSSAWSSTVGMVEQYTKPAQPMNLHARATISTTMVLTWDAVPFVTTAGAAGTLTADYQVERRVSGSADWTSVTGTVTCTAGTCTLSDNNGGSNLAATTHYYYRVRATATRTPTGGASTMYKSYWSYTNQRTPQ